MREGARLVWEAAIVRAWRCTLLGAGKHKEVMFFISTAPGRRKLTSLTSQDEVSW